MKKILVLVVVVLIIEGLSGAFLYFNSSVDKEHNGINTPITSLKKNKDSIYAHPYFGYLSHEQYEAQFHSEAKKQIPQVELKSTGPLTKEIIRIALLGGSVADDLFSFIRDSKSLTSPCKEKNIIIKNFSQRGGKQPQQFHLSLHHLDKFDLAINVEGLNEILQTPVRNFPIEYPIHSPLLFPSTPERIREVTSHTAQLYRSRASFDYWKELPFQTPKLISYLIYSIALNKSRDLENRLNESSIASMQERINVWFKYSLRQRKLLESQGKKTILIFQPIPFLAAKNLAFADHSMNKAEKQKKHYLEGKRAIIKHHSIEFKNWVDLNTEEMEWQKESQFADVYGHFNITGQQSLFSAILKIFLREQFCEISF